MLTQLTCSSALLQVLGVSLRRTLPRMTYADAMERYGCDKPDVRYDLRLHDVTAAVQGTSFRSVLSQPI